MNYLPRNNYDGAPATTTESTIGVQVFLKENFPNIQYIHCYAHHATSIPHILTSLSSLVRLFFFFSTKFPDLSHNYFSVPPRRLKIS